MKLAGLLLSTMLLFVSSVVAEESDSRKAGILHPNMCTGPLADIQVSELPDGAVASLDGKLITQADIDAEAGKLPPGIRTQAKDYPLFAFEQFLVKSLLVKEAKSWDGGKDKKDVDDMTLVRDYLEKTVVTTAPTDIEVKEFYEKNKATFGGASFEQTSENIKAYLADEKKAQAQGEFVNGVSRRHKVVVSPVWLNAAAQKWELNPVEKARRSGKPSLVVFGTVGCCDKMGPVVQKIKQDNSGQITAEFVNIHKEQVLAGLYRVNNPPLILAFDKEGKEKFRHCGNLTADEIQAKLTEAGVR